MSTNKTIELFTLKDRFGRGQYLVVKHDEQKAFIVEYRAHFDSMGAISGLIKFMNCFKLYGDRTYATLDIHLNTSDYCAKYTAVRKEIDYTEIADQLNERAKNGQV